MNINPLTAIDFYKTDHRRQYPENTTEVYSNFTPRSGKLAKVLWDHYDNKVVFFGFQYFLRSFLIEAWNDGFFSKPKEEVLRIYKRRMDHSLIEFAVQTGTPIEFVQFQAHDFSFRGMSGLEDSALSAAAHLTSFYGTDTVPGIDLVEDYYQINSDSAPVGFSVPATEHSVMCMGMKDGELETFRRLISDLYPSGIVSIVSDTWDFWKVVTEFTVELKSEILKRNGKWYFAPIVVIL